MTDNEIQHRCTILFADISGSTALYERLGDAAAQRTIGYTLEKIGDELMCCFENTSDALHASCTIHDTLDQQTDPGGMRLAVRIGIHYGPAIRKD